MAKDNHCPECNAEILKDAPEGLCPKCLMKLVREREPASGLDSLASIEGPGTKIGHYELLELIGEGGMGLVYLAGRCGFDSSYYRVRRFFNPYDSTMIFAGVVVSNRG